MNILYKEYIILMNTIYITYYTYIWVVIPQEAFNVIDQNRDGFIDKEDLIEMMTSLGKNPSDQFINDMILEAPGTLSRVQCFNLLGIPM